MENCTENQGLLEEKALEGFSPKPQILREREPLSYHGEKDIDLGEYLNRDAKYHNWSRSCDVGH